MNTMNKAYDILSIAFAGGILLTIGIFFLGVKTPKKKELHNYHIAGYALAVAYFSFFVLNILEYFSRSENDNILLTQMVTLVVACSQAFMFTFTLITLINTQFVSRRKLIIELVPVLTFVVAILVTYLTDVFKTFLYVFIILYIGMLIRFTRMFITNYRKYQTQMDNYFSGDEASRLRWVYISFFIALFVGIMAIFSSLFMSEIVSLIFSIIIIGFYIYFGIRFINYGLLSYEIELVITEPDTPTEVNDMEMFKTIEEKINAWLADKQFTQNNITIEQISTQIYTNRTYFSEYIHTFKKQSFRNWINDLRIDEAKALMVKHPEMTIHEIALSVGFANKSHFGQVFLKKTGLTPSAWRKLELGIRN
jgi:AraC-like DNA-binding protein